MILLLTVVVSAFTAVAAALSDSVVAAGLEVVPAAAVVDVVVVAVGVAEAAADADAGRHLLPGHRAELLPDGSGDRAPVLPAHRGGLPSAF